MKIWNTSENSEKWVNNIIRNIKDISVDRLEELLPHIDFVNRNIYLDSITPSIATKIDAVIRFWNLIDEKDINNLDIGAREPIKFYICTLGGSLSAAMSIVDTIKLSKTPVYTINTGTVYKEGFYVYLAGRKRFSYPRASFYWEKDIMPFNITETQSNYDDFLEDQKLELKDLVLESTRITENDYEKRKGWWMTAEKANSLHVCNEVLRNSHLL